MKTPLNNFVKPTLLLLTLVFLIAACKKDDAPEINNPDPNPDNPDGMAQDSVPPVEDPTFFDPDLITQSLVLDNMTLIEGELPADKTTRSMPVDLKIDTDTIFWTPGYTQRVKFKKPEGTEIQTALLHVTGSKSYIQADFRIDEASEEVSILYFGFDPTSWELPVTFPIKIIVLDSGGSPLDEFELPVVIEKPFEGVDLTGKLSGADDYIWEVNSTQNWFWKYTVNESLIYAQYVPKNTPGTTEGCCTAQGNSDPGGSCSDPVELEYENVALTKLLKFVLYADGTVYGREDSVYKNLDVWNSDFCSNTDAYSETHGEGLTFELPLDLYANFSINGHVMKFENVSLNETMIGAGQFVEFRLLSEHFLVERLVGTPDSPLPDGLGNTLKLYQRANVIFSTSDPLDDNLHNQPWRD